MSVSSSAFMVVAPLNAIFIASVSEIIEKDSMQAEMAASAWPKTPCNEENYVGL
jgi:hypothetical protein